LNRLRDAMGRSGNGFTLIEIIAVLVVLGILAVVAVPRYADMQGEARRSAAISIIAAAQSQLSQEYAKIVLEGGTAGEDASAICQALAVGSAGESALVTCSGNMNGLVTISASVGSVTITGNWASPETGGS
jgi:prepilin-type N-terminal cleavage/methylation domain-containing protein